LGDSTSPVSIYGIEYAVAISKMETQFYITLSFKTWEGFQTFARFFIGSNPDVAYDIFRKLKGSDEADEKNVLYIDFIETCEGLPKNLKVKSCTLQQLTENCGIITKELFKFFNFEDV
jgi:hypothetical protein